MTRIFTDGAESGDVLFWNIGSAVTVDSGTYRIGGRSYHMINSSLMVSSKTFTPVSEFYLRFAFKGHFAPDLGPAWRYYGTQIGRLTCTSGNGYKLALLVGGTQVALGTTVLNNTVWYLIELHVRIADSGGIIEATLDGVPEVSYGGDTKPDANTTVNNLGFGVYGWLDDLALNDTSGEVDNSWCGDGHVYVLTPNGNGSASEQLGSDGNSTDNYLLVDEIPPNGDTDYVQSSTTGQKDLYNFTSIPSLAGQVVKRVRVESRSRVLSADGKTLQVGVKGGVGSGSPSAENWSTPMNIGISYDSYGQEFPLNPATGSPWTEEEINNIEAGIKIG